MKRNSRTRAVPHLQVAYLMKRAPILDKSTYRGKKQIQRPVRRLTTSVSTQAKHLPYLGDLPYFVSDHWSGSQLYSSLLPRSSPPTQFWLPPMVTGSVTGRFSQLSILLSLLQSPTRRS